MTRNYSPDYRKKHGPKYPDPYPVEILKRVDRPTTIIHDDKVPQQDEREGGFSFPEKINVKRNPNNFSIKIRAHSSDSL